MVINSSGVLILEFPAISLLIISVSMLSNDSPQEIRKKVKNNMHMYFIELSLLTVSLAMRHNVPTLQAVWD